MNEINKLEEELTKYKSFIKRLTQENVKLKKKDKKRRIFPKGITKSLS